MLFLAACGGQAEEPIPTEAPADPVTLPAEIEEEVARLNVIATTFPQYDFIRQIAGDRVDLRMLISPGAEAHAFEPTPSDMIAMLEADLFVYTGGHGETWIDTILDTLDNDTLTVVALMDFATYLLLADHDHDHDHSHDHDHDDHHDTEDHDHSHDHDHETEEYDHSHAHDDHHDTEEHDHSHGDDHDYDYDHDHSHDHGHHHYHDYDEHIWTSPRNATGIVNSLAEVLAELDPDHADYFRANAAAYNEALMELDAAFREVVEQGVRSTVVFGDRFPFRYLMHDLGLTAHAAFPGCSAETTASPATIAALIETVRAEEIPVIFYIEFSSRLIAEVIAEDTGARLLELHSAHNVSYGDFTSGVTYLDLMWRNVEHLREALS